MIIVLNSLIFGDSCRGRKSCSAEVLSATFGNHCRPRFIATVSYSGSFHLGESSLASSNIQLPAILRQELQRLSSLNQLDFWRCPWNAPSFLGQRLQREFPSRRILPRFQQFPTAVNSSTRIAEASELLSNGFLTSSMDSAIVVCHHLLPIARWPSLVGHRSLINCHNGGFNFGESSLASR